MIVSCHQFSSGPVSYEKLVLLDFTLSPIIQFRNELMYV